MSIVEIRGPTTSILDNGFASTLRCEGKFQERMFAAYAVAPIVPDAFNVYRNDFVDVLLYD